VRNATTDSRSERGLSSPQQREKNRYCRICRNRRTFESCCGLEIRLESPRPPALRDLTFTCHKGNTSNDESSSHYFSGFSAFLCADLCALCVKTGASERKRLPEVVVWLPEVVFRKVESRKQKLGKHEFGGQVTRAFQDLPAPTSTYRALTEVVKSQ